jgi:hypothetical protein
VQDNSGTKNVKGKLLMSQRFDITVTNPTLSLDANGYGETSFSVTNSSSEARRVAIKLATLNPQHKNWLKIEGDLEREFLANGTHQYRVNIEVPPDKFKGRFNFRLDVHSALEPQDKLSQGPTVSVEMKPVAKAVAIEPSPKKEFPGLVATVVVLMLLSMGGGIGLWLLSSEIAKTHEELFSLKNLANSTISKANQVLETAKKATSKADQALGTANTAVFKANQAFGTVNSAISQAEKAQTTANTALNHANQVIRRTNRYKDNRDGTVTDNSTGLIWLTNANCFAQKNWEAANRLVQQLKSGDCGLSDASQAGDWRLPTKSEWQVMMNKTYFNPVLSNTVGTDKWVEGQPFSGLKSDNYWSASLFALNTESALVVNLSHALVYVNNKNDTYYVWPVRGGQ